MRFGVRAREEKSCELLSERSGRDAPFPCRGREQGSLRPFTAINFNSGEEACLKMKWARSEAGGFRPDAIFVRCHDFVLSPFSTPIVTNSSPQPGYQCECQPINLFAQLLRASYRFLLSSLFHRHSKSSSSLGVPLLGYLTVLGT